MATSMEEITLHGGIIDVAKEVGFGGSFLSGMDERPRRDTRKSSRRRRDTTGRKG